MSHQFYLSSWEGDCRVSFQRGHNCRPSHLADVPLATIAAALGGPQTSTGQGGVVVGHTSPPIPAKIVAKVWRGEFIDLNSLLPHRLGAPEPTLVDATVPERRKADCYDRAVGGVLQCLHECSNHRG